jgi:hypothetical protein
MILRLLGLWRVQLRVEQNAPALTVRMHNVYSATIRNQGSTLIRPFEDRALQVEDVRSARSHQLCRRLRRAHAYRAVKHDWLSVRRFAQSGRHLAGCFRPNGAGQVTDLVFFARTHVDEQRSALIAGRHPLGEFARAHLRRLRPIALYPSKDSAPSDGVLRTRVHGCVGDPGLSKQKNTCRYQGPGSSRSHRSEINCPFAPHLERRTNISWCGRNYNQST